MPTDNARFGVSVYASLLDPVPVKAGETTWGGLKVFLQSFAGRAFPPVVVRGKDACGAPLWAPHTLKEAKRSNSNVEALWALVLDFDAISGIVPSIQHLQEVWGDWEGFAHTTKSHTNDKPRGRVTLLFDRPVTIREFKSIWKWAVARCASSGLTADQACKDVGRCYYVPFGKFDFISWGGKALPVDEIIAGVMSASASGAPSGNYWEMGDDQVFYTKDGAVTVSGWASTANPGDKLKGFCPKVEDSTFGCAFLRRRRGGVLFVCTSSGHGHDTPLRGWWADGQAGAAAPAMDRSIVDELEWKLDKEGNRKSLKGTLHNFDVILRKDARWAGRLWYDEFAEAAMLDGASLTDEDIQSTRAWVEFVYGISFTFADARRSIRCVSKGRVVNALRDELLALKWDGVLRLDSLLHKGFAAADVPIHRVMGRRWLIQAIARALRPGCQADATLVLHGAQGTKKSTGMEALIGTKWFSRSEINITARQAPIQLGRAWVHEIGERASFYRKGDDTVKNFLTQMEDVFVPPYGAEAVRWPRKCCFFCTTNEEEFLTDPTGDRRFWVVACGEVDIAWLRANREQLLAEAVAALKGGESYFLDTQELRELQSDLNDRFRVRDSWDDDIAHWLASTGKPVTTVAELETDALEIPTTQRGRTSSTRVGIIMRKLGWRKVRLTVSTVAGITRPWFYIRGDVSDVLAANYVAGGIEAAKAVSAAQTVREDA